MEPVDSGASTSRPVRGGTLPERWWAATRDGIGRPDFQLHRYNDDLYLLRQTARSHEEKPFLYLLFGRSRAILFDTGADGGDVATAVEEAVGHWLGAHDRRSIPLVVAHLHGHADHIAGDVQLARLPDTTVVPPGSVPALQALFGIVTWPTGLGRYDLGDRVLEVVPVPGHDETSIAVYDRQTGLLLTGDTMYPGRIYINLADHAVFTASVDRLVEFARARVVTHVLGTHIEQRGPYRDAPVGTTFAPDEGRLELSYGQLLELQQGAHDLDPAGMIVQRAFRDFSICGPYPRCDPLLPDGGPRRAGVTAPAAEGRRPPAPGPPGR
jgi:glyoxylase-like metal-dependent hydrolase (beta-lactamase superfamily II)